MDRRPKRTVISLEDDHQQQLDFEEAAHSLPFTFPEYQRDLIVPRIMACLMDFAVVAAIFLIFIVTTINEMPDAAAFDKRVLGIYGVCYLALVVIYFLLFMLSASQTPGMKIRQLIVVTRDDELLDPKHACMRGLGYLVSILPLLLGMIWILIDPEHLSWADKVSSTYVRRMGT
jgi:uncharacterized RDD family membrane protein YckC